MKNMKRWFIAVLALVCIMMVFVGCGKKGIEGEWVLVKEVTGTGETLSKEDLEKLGVSETYTISGENVHYVLEMSLSNKPIEIDFTLEDLGDGKYNFMAEDYTFATVTVKGDKMTYTAGQGETSSTMTFERK